MNTEQTAQKELENFSTRSKPIERDEVILKDTSELEDKKQPLERI